METADKGTAIEYLTEHRKTLLERREQMIKPLQELDQEIEHITAALRSIQKKPVAVGFRISIETPEFPLAQLRNLTQVQALVKIAKHSGGIIKAQEAKRLLIRAGVMRQTKNSTNVIHAVIVRSERFERVRPGEYRLKNFETQTGGNNSANQIPLQ